MRFNIKKNKLTFRHHAHFTILTFEKNVILITIKSEAPKIRNVRLNKDKCYNGKSILTTKIQSALVESRITSYFSIRLHSVHSTVKPVLNTERLHTCSRG